MATTQLHERAAPLETAPVRGMPATAAKDLSDPRYQAFWLLRIAYTAIPLTMGIDKYFNGLVYWPKYLADWIDNIAPGTAQQFMYFVGGVEILAGVIVALKPRYGAYIVAAWLAGIVINLFGALTFYRSWQYYGTNYDAVVPN